MKISIIIPTYNRAHLLNRTIASLQSQTYPDWECLVVDDFSTDGTKGVIEEYRKKEERIYYIINERSKGAQGARNTGLLHSKGEWVVFFDSDNIMHPDFLRRTYETVIKESVDICGTFSRIIDYSTGESIGMFTWKGYGRIHKNLMTGKSYFDNSSTLIKKEKVFQIGILDEECPSYQEWDTHIRLSRIATYTTIQEALVDYYRGGSDTISASKEKDIKGLLFILHKYKWEWILRFPKTYLIKQYIVYDDLQKIKASAEYEELLKLYLHRTYYFMRVFVSILYTIKNRNN